MNKTDPDFLASLSFAPLTTSNWYQFEKLFGSNGACGNCWCMYYRRLKTDFIEGKSNDGNKQRMKDLVWDGKPTGILGFYEGEAIAWLALAPREDFVKLAGSRVHKPIDDEPVWSAPCFFIAKALRRQGVSVALLKGAIAYAKSQKIRAIEAYPTIPTKEPLPDSFAWIGLYKSFERAGFQIVDQTSKHRPMVRCYTYHKPKL